MRSLDSASTEIAQRPLKYLPRTDYDLIKAHSYAAVITLFPSAIAGLLVALKLTLPDLLGNHAALSWGRLRFDHTQGIFFGWLGNAFFAFCYHMMPRLADRPVYSRKLGWGIFQLWNLCVLLPGWALISLGLDSPWLAVQSLERGESPMLIDLLAVLGLLLIYVQFAGPFVLKRQSGGLYISAWTLWVAWSSACLPIRPVTSSRHSFRGRRARLSADCGFTMRSGCLSRRLCWRLPITLFRQPRCDRSTVIFYR
nr:cbb3-type cytochrome c oxidase subunit I [Pseudomonas khorasanensis]